MIERIDHNGEEVATIIRANHIVHGAEFVSSNEDPLQVGMLERRKGDVAQPHWHPYEPQTISAMHEIIFVVRGRLRLTIFDEATEGEIYKTELLQGDLVVHKKHGHGVEFLEDSLIYEVKQGPFTGEKSKVFLQRKY